MGEEKTTIGPQSSLCFISFICSMILGIPFPSTSRRLPPNFATERDLKVHSTQ